MYTMINHHWSTICLNCVEFEMNVSTLPVELRIIHLVCFIYTFIGKRQRCVQSALHFTPGRPVHSNKLSTSLGSIKQRCNYCAKTIRSDIHLCMLAGTIYS